MNSFPKYSVRKLTNAAVLRARHDNENGETLIELLIAIMVIGIAAVALILTFSTSIFASSEYRNLASSDTVLRTALEEATSQIQQLPSSTWGSSCGITNASVGTLSLPSGYTATISSVRYWNNATSSFSTTCVANSAVLIAVQTTATATGATQTISSVINDPWMGALASFGPASKLVFLQQPADTTVGAIFSISPEIAIEDSANNIVTSDLSSMTLTIASGPSATLSNCSGSEFAGVITFTGCSINTIGTGYTLTATDGSLTAATPNTFNITAGSPTQLAFTAQTSSGSSGVAWSPQPSVSVEDASGNVVTTATNPVTLAITTQPSGGGTLTCNANPVSASSGVATFAGCRITGAAGSYTVTASATGLSSATTSFTVSTGATKLDFTAGAGRGSSGVAWSPQPSVSVEDASGNVVTTATNPVTLTITAQPSGGATLSCSSNPTTASGGTATFAGCKINGAAGTYTLVASATSITSTTMTFTLGVGSASALAFTTQPLGTTSGNAWPTQPIVSIEDSGGNVVTTATNPVTLAITTQPSGGGTLTCNANPVSASSGVATFAGCRITGAAGSYTVTASATGLSSATATVNISTPSNYSGSSSSNIPNGPEYYSINTLQSRGSSSSGNNTMTPGVAETLTGLTFTINSSSPATYRATIGTYANNTWSATALSCNITGRSGSSKCTISGSVKLTSTGAINIAVTGNGYHSGTWTTTYTQP